MNDGKSREGGQAARLRGNLQAVNSGYDYRSAVITPEEYRLLYGAAPYPAAQSKSTAQRARAARPKAKRRWRFKPHSLGALIVWGVILLAGFRIVVAPLVGGTYHYFAKDYEMRRLQTQYETMRHQLADMKKARDKMKTMAYVEERGHQIGLIKSNEAKMVVVESSNDGRVFRAIPRNNEIYGY